MQITVTPLGGGVKIEFDSFDAFVFATRPNNMWPVSDLRHGPDNMMLELDEEGDLIDSANIPDETSASEVNAFIEFAVEHAHNRLGEELLRINFRDTWKPEPIKWGAR